MPVLRRHGCVGAGVHIGLGRGLPDCQKADPAYAGTYYEIACRKDQKYCGAPAIEAATRFVQSSDPR